MSLCYENASYCFILHGLQMLLASVFSCEFIRRGCEEAKFRSPDTESLILNIVRRYATRKFLVCWGCFGFKGKLNVTIFWICVPLLSLLAGICANVSIRFTMKNKRPRKSLNQKGLGGSAGKQGGWVEGGWQVGVRLGSLGLSNLALTD